MLTFKKIESIVTLLNALDSPVSNDEVVMYAINGLRDRFAHVSGIIVHRNPFPYLAMVHSMVTNEEMCLNSKQQFLPCDSTS